MLGMTEDQLVESARRLQEIREDPNTATPNEILQLANAWTAAVEFIDEIGLAEQFERWLGKNWDTTS